MRLFIGGAAIALAPIFVKLVIFEILDKDGNIVDTITTNSEGRAITKRLPIDNEYTVREKETINDSIIISGIRVYDGEKGKFIVFPTRTNRRGRRFDIVFPCKDEVRELILQAVVNKYLQEN